MIIIEDYIKEDGSVLKKVYSNERKLIRKKSTGQIYEEAINLNITVDMYEETNQLIEEPSIEEYEIHE